VAQRDAMSVNQFRSRHWATLEICVTTRTRGDAYSVGQRSGGKATEVSLRLHTSIRVLS